MENYWGRIIIIGLTVLILLLTLLLFRKEAIVTVQPFTLSEDAWVTSNQSSRSYKEAWAMAMATMTGNVTPANVDFIKERMGPLLDTEIYQQVLDALEVQAQQIRQDRVTIRFEPRYVEYEESADKVFVYGYSFMSGVTGDVKREDRTYEYRIRIANYAPRFTYMDTYNGRPRTEKVLRRLERKEEQVRELEEGK